MVCKRRKHLDEKKFDGFPPKRQTWQFPTVIDGWVHVLSGSEFKVLWYIMRRTYGWQKTEDKISYSQFEKGIMKRDGTWIDRGTGLREPTISAALKRLVSLGFIERHSDPRSGKTSTYKIRFAATNKTLDPLLNNLGGTSKKTVETINNQSIKDNINVEALFENIWKVYPKKDGKKSAYRYFIATVKTDKDWKNINNALKNYEQHLQVNSVPKRYIKNASNWFNNWMDWVEWQEPTNKVYKAPCRECESTTYTAMVDELCVKCYESV